MRVEITWVLALTFLNVKISYFVSCRCRVENEFGNTRGKFFAGLDARRRKNKKNFGENFIFLNRSQFRGYALISRPRVLIQKQRRTFRVLIGTHRTARTRTQTILASASINYYYENVCFSDFPYIINCVQYYLCTKRKCKNSAIYHFFLSYLTSPFPTESLINFEAREQTWAKFFKENKSLN